MASRLVVTALSVLLVAAWPPLLHFTVAAQQVPVAALLLVVVLLVLALAVLRVGLPAAALGLLVLLGLGVYRPEWLVRIVPVLIHLLLAWLFGSTLRGQRKPMISRFAELEQGRLSPELALYTRRLTWVWTVFFVLMAAISLLLWASASLQAWSLFTNLVSYALVGALFLGEFAWRHHRFPALRHASPLELAMLIRRSGALTREPPVAR